MQPMLFDSVRKAAHGTFAAFAGPENSTLARLKNRILASERYELPISGGVFLKKFTLEERKLALAAVIHEENTMRTLLNVVNSTNDEEELVAAARRIRDAGNNFGSPSIFELMQKGSSKSLESFVLRQKLDIETSIGVIGKLREFCDEFLPPTSELSISETAPGSGMVSLADNATKITCPLGVFNIGEKFTQVSESLEIPGNVISVQYSEKEKGYVLSTIELNLTMGSQVVKDSGGSLVPHLDRIFTQSGYSFESLHTDIKSSLKSYNISESASISFITLSFKQVNGNGAFVCELSQSFGSPELGKSIKLDVTYLGFGKPLKMAITNVDGKTNEGFEGSYTIA